MGYNYYSYYDNGQDGGADGSGDDGGSDGGSDGGGGYTPYVANQYNRGYTEYYLSVANPSWWSGYNPEGGAPTAPQGTADWAYQMGMMLTYIGEESGDPYNGAAALLAAGQYFLLADQLYNQGVP